MRISRLCSVVALFAPLVQAYDYVIIGGGTGGLTVAGRLSEDPSMTVLVIEVGLNGEDLAEVIIPGLAGKTPPNFNWKYPTTNQIHLNGRSITINAGRALGGSTVINSMIFPRAGKEQYDAWGKLNNNDEWTWERLLPFFKKSELFTPPTQQQIMEGHIKFDNSVHGFDGKVKAAAALGFPVSPDLANGSPHAVGVSPNSLDASNNTRCSATCAYYTPVASRPNLSVLLNATASRIIWGNKTDGELTASAVEYIQGGKTLTVPVGREVVLAAGTIGTPKLLELSGVGNDTVLSNAGVNTILNLSSVGENLADHVHSWANCFTSIGLTKDLLNTNASFAAEQKDLWFKNRTGIFSAAPRVLGIAAPSNLFNTSELKTLVNEARKNLDYFATQFSNGNPQLARGIKAQHEYVLNLYAQNMALPLELNLEPGYSGPTPFGVRPNRTFTTVNSVLYAPLSRGRSHIASSDPLAVPEIDPNYWAHPIDVSAQVGGIKVARRMLQTYPLSESFLGEFEPGTQFQTDEEIERWLRNVVDSDNHEVGTAAMLPREFGGVVDTQLKVYGTNNVRVADASIMPLLISAHLSSTVYAIGEKAADIIKKSIYIGS